MTKTPKTDEEIFWINYPTDDIYDKVMYTHDQVKNIIVRIECDPTIDLYEALWNLTKRLKS